MSDEENPVDILPIVNNDKPNIQMNIEDVILPTKIPRVDSVRSDVSDIIKKEYSILNDLLDLINEKKWTLIESKSILEMKYNKYKRCHNFWNISTIILSSSLTIIESCKLVFIEDIDNNDLLLNDFFKLSPIMLGTIITCTASIIKFKKYQEQMEAFYIVIDKCIAMISKLKNKKDEIILLQHRESNLEQCMCKCGNGNDDEYEMDTDIKAFKSDVKSINDTFKNDIIKDFSTVYQDTSRYINYSDYHKYLKLINKIEYKKHILKKDKECFYNDYEHEIKPERMNEIRDESMNGCDKIHNCCGCPKKS